MLVADIIQNKCPVCRKGHVYQKNNLVSYGHIEMNTACPVCHTNFEKDPGFYWGSMYVSYALSVMEALAGYFICRALGTERFDFVNMLAAVGAILICSPFNFRMARLVWLYIFPNG